MRKNNLNKIIAPLLKFNGFALHRLSFVFIALIIFVGILTLVGWQFDISVLKRPIKGLVAMNPFTALLFIITGGAFLLITPKNKSTLKIILGYILASFAILISLLQIIDLVFLLEWRVDQLLFAKQIQADTAKGLTSSMAINTAISFILSGIALLSLNKNTDKRWPIAHIIAISVFLFGFFSLLGYLYKVPEFYNILKQLPMAVHTSVGFILIAIAIFFIYPDKGITKEFTGLFAGAIMGRRLIGFIIIFPLILGLIKLAINRTFLISIELGTTFLILFLIIFFIFFLLYNVVLLNKKDALQKSIEKKLFQSREIFRSLVISIRDYAIYMLDTKGCIITWNKGAEDIKGYSEEEIIGKHISVFYTEEDIKSGMPDYILKMTIENNHFVQEGWRVKKDKSKFWADVLLTALYDENGVHTGFAKVTRDITEQKKAKDILAEFNEELGKQVKEKTKQIEETAMQLRQLSAHLQTAREEERKYIAREIHDDLGQMLTALRMDISWLRKKIAPTDDAITLRFERAVELLQDTRQSLRRISTNLHPALLEDLGLTAALKLYSKEFEERAEIKTELTINLAHINDMDLLPQLSIGIFRVFQEVLNNAAKHSNASKLEALLKTENDSILLKISDNGKGFSISKIKGETTLGLISMRERALMMDGKFEIESTLGKGTKALLIVPIKLK